MSERKPAKRNVRDRALAILSLALGSMILVGIVADAAITGSGSGVVAWLAGLVSGGLLTVGLVLGYRAALATQVDRIRESPRSNVVAVSLDDRTRASLESSGLYPLFSLHNLAVVPIPGGLELWTGIRRPFAFATLPASQIASWGSDGRHICLELRGDNRRRSSWLYLAPRSIGRRAVRIPRGEQLATIAVEMRRSVEDGPGAPH